MKVWTHSQKLTLQRRVEQARERFMESATRTFEVWERAEKHRRRREAR